MSHQPTEDVTIEGEVYTIRTRLGWLELRRIEDSGIRLFVDGSEISKAANLDALENIEMRLDRARQDLMRLESRLVNWRRKQIEAIPPAHVDVLLARIDELEREQQAEIEALNPKSTNGATEKKLIETSSSES